MYRDFDIVIIGAGAAGLAAAISSSRLFEHYNVKYKLALVEKSKFLGKKILITGNGKCNISNINISSEFYYGGNSFEINKIINQFTYNDMNEFFNSLGLMIRNDAEGRAYPLSGQASSVVDAMVEELNRLNVEKFCDFDVTAIEILNNGLYEVNSRDIVIRCKKIVICTGGRSAPFSGYDGDGYGYLKKLGHSVTRVFPALVPIKSNSILLKQLKGVRWTCGISLFGDKDVIKSELGEVQFNANNLSGICIFQISRLVSEFAVTSQIHGKYYNNIYVSLDLFPNYSMSNLEGIMLNRIKRYGYISVEGFMTGIINKKLAMVLLKELKNFPNSRLTSTLQIKELKNLIKLFKNFKFKIDGVMDWKHSQVTAGGAMLSEFYPETLESRKKRGLYCAGEILDVDGMCGGYNLHWAWASGCISGCGATRSIIEAT